MQVREWRKERQDGGNEMRKKMHGKQLTLIRILLDSYFIILNDDSTVSSLVLATSSNERSRLPQI